MPGSANAGSRSEDFHFLFKLADPSPIRFDRFDETVESGVQIVFPRIGERDGQLRRGMANEIKVLLFW